MSVVRPVEATEEALLDDSCKGFLPESEGRVGAGCAGAVTPEAVERLLAGEGARKEDDLGSPKDDAERGVDVVPLLLACKS